MEKVLAEKIEEERKNQPIEEDTLGFVINPKINIDEEKFNTILNNYTAKLKANKKMNLASALENGRSRFEHNKWFFSTENEILMQMLERETDLLPFMREKTGVSDLFWDLSVQETEEANKARIPYTNEEKLSEMAKQNPNLRKLQEIFKTRIIYD